MLKYTSADWISSLYGLVDTLRRLETLKKYHMIDHVYISNNV